MFMHNSRIKIARSTAGSTILEVVYGIETERGENTSYFGVIEEALRIVSEIGNAGSYVGKPISCHH